MLFAQKYQYNARKIKILIRFTGQRKEKLCTISPLEGEYEPGKPEFGFLYLAFRDRTTNTEYINIFEKQPGQYTELKEWMLRK